MDEQSKQDARSLAENLNLELRGVVQRALPEYFTLDREPKRGYRGINDSERLNFSLDYVFLDEREKWLAEEKSRLKKKYLELKKAIELEETDVARQKERLLMAVRYSVISETLEQEKASAPTNLMSPSKDLAQK